MIALQKTIRRVAESGELASDDPAMKNLKKSLLLKFADQQVAEPRKGSFRK